MCVWLCQEEFESAVDRPSGPPTYHDDMCAAGALVPLGTEHIASNS